MGSVEKTIYDTNTSITILALLSQ